MSRLITKTLALLALLLLGVGAAGRSSADASGYMLSSGFSEEIVCEPGGSSDCTSVT